MRTGDIQKTNDSRLLSLSLTPVKGNGAMALRWTVRNISDESIWLNARFLVLPKDSIVGDAWLEIIDAAGRVIPPNDCRVRAGRPDLSDYVRLRPDSEVSVVSSMGCFSIPAGKLTIVGHLHDKNTITRGFPSDALWFVGELKSEPIRLDFDRTRNEGSP